jgi:plasmid stabilization system protein ParE
MKRYRLSGEARDDIDDLWAFIAADNLEAADRLVKAIHDACAVLGENPTFGHFRHDITGLQVRFHTVMKNYLIVYDPLTSPIMIVRVLHGARDATALLK